MKKNIFTLLFFIFAINGFSQSINVSEMYKTIDYSDKKFDFLVEKGLVLSPPYGENGKYIFTHPQTKESLLIQYNLAYEKDAGDFATAIYKFSNRDYFDKFIQSLPENIFEYNPQNKIYIRQNRDPAYEKISIVKQAPTQESLFTKSNIKLVEILPHQLLMEIRSHQKKPTTKEYFLMILQPLKTLKIFKAFHT